MRKSRDEEKPIGELRTSQAVGTYGPGAMIDGINDSLLIAGLDEWSYKDAPAQWANRRLAAKISNVVGALGYTQDVKLRAPPEAESSADSKHRATREHGIRALLFPRWRVCNKCGAMQRHDRPEDRPADRSDHRHKECKQRGVWGPIRFVAVCADGHLADVNWRTFVHQGSDCKSHEIFLQEDTGELSSVAVKCGACSARRTLSEYRGIPCEGRRPWLDDSTVECERIQQLQVRTASSTYFPVTVSALTLPKANAIEELHATFARPRDQLPDSLSEVASMRKLLRSQLAAWNAYTDEQIWSHLQDFLHHPPQPAELRQEEWGLFTATAGMRDGVPERAHHDFSARAVDLRSGRAGQAATRLAEPLSHLVQVSRVTEERVQVGFTRLSPLEPDIDGDIDGGTGSIAPLALHRDWLPAVRHHGEGIFLALSEQRLQEWEARPAVVEREKVLRAGYEQAQRKPPLFFGARYYLLHALSHALISALALECGYAVASIRERLYCSRPDAMPSRRMAGVLLVTTAPGAGGTLGGLVEQATPERMLGHLQRAWDMSVVCSSDPVCASHDPAHAQSEKRLEGAACHGCLYVPEPSCERWNRFLDRALLVPTIDHDPALAFFSSRPE